MRKKTKSFTELFPDKAQEAFGWDPSEIAASSHLKLKWKCKLNHLWEATPHDRSRKDQKSNCPYCGNKKLLKGFNDLKSVNPDIAEEAFNFDPTTILAGTNKKFTWKCKKGHIWQAKPGNRVREGIGCPYCSNRYILVGLNDLNTTHPELSREAFNWDTTTLMAGSNKKMEWKCGHNHLWKATPKDRTTHHQGCPSCSKYGFDPNKKGYLYFLIHPIWEMYQIGISNNPEDRLKDHFRKGWNLIELRGPFDGYQTKELETSLLRFLRLKGAQLSPDFIAGKFDGYSESWLIDSFGVDSLKTLISDMKMTETDT